MKSCYVHNYEMDKSHVKKVEETNWSNEKLLNVTDNVFVLALEKFEKVSMVIMTTMLKDDVICIQ